MRKIGVLTSGGDSPGMNAAITAVALSAARRHAEAEIIGIKDGFKGLLGKSLSTSSNMDTLSGETILDIQASPGTYLKTARCEEFMLPLYQQVAALNLLDLGIHDLVVIGGDGSFRGMNDLCRFGIRCVGIPATIDNDLPYTQFCIGFDTALNCCVDAIRAVRATSRSHGRAHIVEAMGRDCGNIALYAAVAAGAEICLIPEIKWDLTHVAARLKKLIDEGNKRVTIVLAEGAFQGNMVPFNVEKYLLAKGKQDLITQHGTKLTTSTLARILRMMVPESDIRATVVGYTQRGLSPTAHDCIFAYEAADKAVSLLINNRSGRVIGQKNGKIFDMSISDALAAKPRFNKNMYSLVSL